MTVKLGPSHRAAFSRAHSCGQIQPRWLGFVCGIQCLGLLALAWLWQRDAASLANRKPVPAQFATQSDAYFSGPPGPWGELEFARINIEPTDDSVTAEIAAFQPTRWFFEHLTREQVLALCLQVGFTEAQLTELRRDGSWLVQPDGVLVGPPGNLIMALPPEVRAPLYAVLARHRRNDLQAWPFVFRQGGFDEWFEQSGLSAATLALVKQVIYQRGPALCVSDAPELCARIPDVAERQRLIKTLSRNSSLLMKIRVRPESDVKALAAYWGQGWHVKDIEPLLASLTKVPGSITLDIAHLLPPFARKRLNSYPAPLEPGQRAPDCYWTAWNFFRDPPDDRYFDDTIWRRELQQHCEPVAQPTFGDLVFLTRPDGVPIHCAVFVAADVVFTKNGANLRQPWKLMQLEDLLARYPEDFPLRVALFRAKPSAN